MDILNSIKTNNIKKFEKLIDNYVPLHGGFNILHETICREQYEMSQIIIQKFPNLVGRDYPSGSTPLMYAIIACDMKFIKLFDGHIAYLTRTYEGNTPLHIAILHMDLEGVRYVLNQEPSAIRKKNDAGHTPLHTSALNGISYDIVRFLYETDQSQNKQDPIGNYPIHLYGQANEFMRFMDADQHNGALSFLAKKDPEILLKKNNKGNLPIHELMSMFTINTSKLFQEISNVIDICPESLLIRNNFGELPIHIAAFYHDVWLTSKIIDIYPHLLYEPIYVSSESKKCVLDYFSFATDNVILNLVRCLMKHDNLLDSFWEFIPRPLIGLECYLHEMSQDVRNKMFVHLTRKTRNKLKDRYLLLGHYFQKRNITIELEIIDKIILRSLKT